VERNLNEYKIIENSNIRKIIAQRLLESKQTVPHFYLSVECNIDKLLALRADLNSEQEAFKLSINDFIIKAVAIALAQVPEANASWTEDAILQYNNIDISVAVALENGLITPIIKNADCKSIIEISNEMKSLAKRARETGLKPEEFQGGGFSISNLGMYKIKNFKAIINPPQSCIMAVGASNKRAIVINEQIKMATMMDISLSCDHRVIDGAVAAKFLSYFQKMIENPIKMIV
jgi:pyruvate dehydrogenase E2 component (dihydrolipoamide acetyltransferase)